MSKTIKAGELRVGDRFEMPPTFGTMWRGLVLTRTDAEIPDGHVCPVRFSGGPWLDNDGLYADEVVVLVERAKQPEDLYRDVQHHAENLVVTDVDRDNRTITVDACPDKYHAAMLDGDRRAEWDRREKAFLDELTALCRKHGLTLEGGTTAGDSSLTEAAGEIRVVDINDHLCADPGAQWWAFRDGTVHWQK